MDEGLGRCAPASGVPAQGWSLESERVERSRLGRRHQEPALVSSFGSLFTSVLPPSPLLFLPSLLSPCSHLPSHQRCLPARPSPALQDAGPYSSAETHFIFYTIIFTLPFLRLDTQTLITVLQLPIVFSRAPCGTV